MKQIFVTIMERPFFMLHILLFLFSCNIIAMSNIDRQKQERFIHEKQLLLYQNNMAIATTNASQLEKFFAQTYNKIIFLNTLEIHNLTAPTLLHLINTDQNLLSLDIYSPAIMNSYAKRHKEFIDKLINVSMIKNKQNYTLEDAKWQSAKVLQAIPSVHDETVRQWLNASLAYTIMHPQRFEYMQAKATLTQLHNRYPNIIPQP